ncbi:MAG: DUF1801 domain-containing protein [Aliifodinibius sp.]|nr:DUF1801 domain-containing protein [candidate division Zixibacteria bacterium]NIT57211.1 DUF1801 domain-containing protein [Fodinibius sp.]NIW40167.1 DUF1801 domain-containing protein [candidate division Zixibacteria bacterium]NIX56286.1 DUF1801 domain-containing protein [candidate division Zixibacteria bacterium]NIY25793.1 DUF1801 domain-containing protein [Fodinibius sp.]
MSKIKQGMKDVMVFLNKLDDERRRQECLELIVLLSDVTGEEPRLWNDSIIGFGSYHYKYKSGREGDWFLTGFSPRKQYLTIYILPGLEAFPSLLNKLGKPKIGKSCLYLKGLRDIDKNVLKRLVQTSVRLMKETHAVK